MTNYWQLIIDHEQIYGYYNVCDEQTVQSSMQHAHYLKNCNMGAGLSLRYKITTIPGICYQLGNPLPIANFQSIEVVHIVL
jgi:hypothetical protein